MLLFDESPIPLTAIITGLSSASFDGMSKVSLNEPVVVGENLTVNVQLAAGVKVCAEQLSTSMLNGSPIGSAWAILPIIRSALPSLVTVTVFFDKLPFGYITKIKGIW